MRRIKEQFAEILERNLPLGGASILEVGCGTGIRSMEIARRCGLLWGVDPCVEHVGWAQCHKLPNAKFCSGRAEALPFRNNLFDFVIFTLSLHHVPAPLMSQAIDEAVRTVKREGHIVFLEPGEDGSFFEAEIEFDAGDGDEREEKRLAKKAVRAHPRLRLENCFDDETAFDLVFVESFTVALNPKRNLHKIESFLAQQNHVLKATRRIDICRVVQQ